MSMRRRSPRAVLLVTLAVGAGSAIGARSSWADTVYLRDGRIVKGQVTKRPDGKVEIASKHGALVVDESDVVRVEPSGAKAEAAQTDTVYTTDGRVFTGNVGWSDETHEVVISNDRYGETRIPRTLVKAIKYREGKQAPSALALPADAAVITTEEDAEKKWRAQIDACIEVLRAPTSDDKDRKKARGELLELGVFAIPYVTDAMARLSETDARDLQAKGVLRDVLRVAEMKAVVSGRMEEEVKGICEQLVDSDEAIRKKALRDAVLIDPDASPKLLLYLINKDPSPGVKALCVGQLSLLKRFEELAAVLKMPENGQLRLVAALELGEAGIYVGIPVIIEALKLDGPQFKDVRATAIDALKRYTGQGNLGYLADTDDRAEREVAIKRWESWWQAEGESFARKHGSFDPKDVPEDAKIKALDRWRDGNKVLDDLAERQKKSAEKNAVLDPKEVLFAYETAAYLFKQALDHDPTLCAARISRAIILYAQLGRAREAESELKLVLNRYAPEESKYLRVLSNLHLGYVAERERDWKRAESYFLTVVRLDESCIDAYVGVGDSFLERALAIVGKPAPPVAAAPAPAGADRKGIPTSPVDAVKPAASDGAATPSVAKGEGKPNPDDDSDRRERETHLLRAINAYKGALDAIDKRQKELLQSVGELGSGETDAPESSKVGRLLVSVRNDRNALVKRAAQVWFRLGRAQRARGDKADALEAFRAATQLDPQDKQYAAVAELFENEKRAETAGNKP